MCSSDLEVRQRYGEKMEVGIEEWKVRKCGAVVEVVEVTECDRGDRDDGGFIMECAE